MDKKNSILKEKKATPEEALELFDSLEAVSIDFMIGKWKGEELLTGHSMDGLLGSTGWHGKVFERLEDVHPLVFYTDKNKTDVFFANPSAVFGLDKKSDTDDSFIANYRSEVETKDSKARIRETKFRDSLTATMIYDELPINDVFKKIDENTVLGLMDMKGDPGNYFFILHRE